MRRKVNFFGLVSAAVVNFVLLHYVHSQEIATEVWTEQDGQTIKESLSPLEATGQPKITKVKQLLNKVKSYYNSFYGFRIQYFGELKEQSFNEVIVKLPKFEESQIIESYVSICVTQLPFIDLPATYGGRFYFSNDSNLALLSNRYAVEYVTVNGLVFTKEYWLVYGGMGSWETIINCYTKHRGQYYVISLNHSFLSGTPGKIIKGRKISKKELIAKGLKEMRDNNNKYVKAFNAMLSSFSISK